VADDVGDKKIKCPKCSAVTRAAPVEQSLAAPEAPPQSEGIAAVPTPRAERDDEDWESPREIARDVRINPTDDAVSTLIPYKNGRALLAYYLGVFSFIPCVGLLLGPAALILGILGLRYVKANPTAKGTGHAIAGIVMGAITSLLYWGALLALMVAGGIAAFNK
jgi:hypothetical protein